MACSRCGRDAVMHAAYSGARLCETHFLESVEKRVRRRIREDNLLGRDATLEDPERWVIGLSGGKDSAVLTTILHDTFERDPRVDLVCLTIHEGIEGYRDESLAACEELVSDRDLPHHVITYEEEFGVQMDDVADEDPLDMAPCAYCGVFRRDILERHARRLSADKLLTGHNLDDEAQTALMNVFEGNVDQIAKHFDASLGRFAEDVVHGNGSTEPGARSLQDRFVPRAKPLRDVPEKEVALYCHLRDLPAHTAECPHASEAFRGTVQRIIFDLEEDHPGTRHSIMAGYEEIAATLADRRRDDGSPVDEEGERRNERTGSCEQCGSASSQSLCRRCAMLEALGV